MDSAGSWGLILGAIVLIVQVTICAQRASHRQYRHQLWLLDPTDPHAQCDEAARRRADRRWARENRTAR